MVSELLNGTITHVTYNVQAPVNGTARTGVRRSKMGFVATGPVSQEDRMNTKPSKSRQAQTLTLFSSKLQQSTGKSEDAAGCSPRGICLHVGDMLRAGDWSRQEQGADQANAQTPHLARNLSGKSSGVELRSAQLHAVLVHYHGPATACQLGLARGMFFARLLMWLHTHKFKPIIWTWICSGRQFADGLTKGSGRKLRRPASSHCAVSRGSGSGKSLHPPTTLPDQGGPQNYDSNAPVGKHN